MFQNFQLLQTRSQLPISQVQFLPGFLLNHEIAAIYKLLEQFPLQTGSIVGNDPTSRLVVRESQIKWLIWNDENWWLYNKIMNKARELNNVIWQFDLFGVNEYIQYTEYDGMQNIRGHYDWHLDASHNGIASNRKLSFECVLDDNHTGGEFSMLLGPSENKLKMGVGDAVFYPSFLLNKIYPVTSGNRKSIVSWIHGPCFK